MPAPYVSLEDEGLPVQQLWFIVLTSAFLLLFIGLLVRWQSRPLKRLAKAAREVGGRGSAAAGRDRCQREIVEVSRAFNNMRERISAI